MVRLVIAVVGLVLLSGCVYANIKIPLDIDLNETELGSKVGESESYSVLFGLVAWGDSGTQAAAADGNITILRHADAKLFNVLGVYTRATTVVYGD